MRQFVFRSWIAHGVILLAVLSGASAARAVEPVRIGITFTRTGALSAPSLMYESGINIWVDHVNARGGLLNRPVALVARDDHGDPGVALEQYRSFLDDGEADLVFGPYSTPMTQAVLPLAKRHGMPMLLPAASSDILWEGDGGYGIGIQAPLSKWPVGFLEVISRAGMTRLAILGMDAPHIRAMMDATTQWARRFGVTVTVSHALDWKNLDKDLSEVRASGAEAVFLWGYIKETIAVRKGLSDIGWRPKAFFATLGPLFSEYPEALGEAADMTFTCAPWDESVGALFPGGPEFVAAFRAANGEAPTYHAACAYAAGMILEQAVARTGTIEPEKLRSALLSMDTLTLIGRYGVDAAGLQVRQFPFLLQWQNGRKEVILPADVRTAEPVFPPDGD